MVALGVFKKMIQPLFIMSNVLHVYSLPRELGSFSDSRTLRISHVMTKVYGRKTNICLWSALSGCLSVWLSVHFWILCMHKLHVYLIRICLLSIVRFLVIRCLNNEVSLTLVREQRFIRIIIITIVAVVVIINITTGILNRCTDMFYNCITPRPIKTNKQTILNE